MNIGLIGELTVLLDEARKQNTTNDRFRAKSYRDAISKIKELPFTITTPEQIPLKKGGKIYQKILEYIIQGHIQKTHDVLNDSSNNLKLFTQLQLIAEIGPRKARELIEDYGIKSIEDLMTRQDLLNDKQKIGLKYWQTDQLRIPRAEIKKHERLYKANVKEVCQEMSFIITGSYRRGTKDSGDIDILLSHSQNNASCFRAFVDRLIDCGYLIDTLAYGEKKYMGYGRLFSDDSLPRRIDIIYCPPHEYPFAILYFTGSGKFNVNMRNHAAKLGYRLNEKGLVDLKTEHFVKHQFNTEEDIMKFLEMEYVEPTKRDMQ